MLDKLEKKINYMKEKVNKKFLAVAIFCIFGFVVITTAQLIKNLKLEKQQIEDEYNKSMYEAVSYINNLENELAKLQLTNTNKLTITTLASIWKQANLAKENFESLPTEQGTLQDASKYLSQVSDFSYSLMKNVVVTDKIAEEEYIKIANIYNKCQSLNDVMIEIYNDLNSGRIKWGELKKQTDSKLGSIDVAQAVSTFEGIDKTFQDYEGLIYDGAFSDHLLETMPKSLSGNIVTVEKAKEFIQNIFGTDNIEYINDKGESSGKIDLYNFEVKLKNKEMIRNISITKKDCKMYLMIADRNVKNESISVEESKTKAKEFLAKIGLENVEDTYYLKTENMAIINFAAVQDDVILYPDLVKVKVALDNGEICSVESQGYIFNNIRRENINPKISLEEAKDVLNQKINVIAERLAIIPTDSKEEVLTYEFKGKIDEKEFLIYVNAITGLEEKVLIIMETPGGILTM